MRRGTLRRTTSVSGGGCAYIVRLLGIVGAPRRGVIICGVNLWQRMESTCQHFVPRGVGSEPAAYGMVEKPTELIPNGYSLRGHRMRHTHPR